MTDPATIARSLSGPCVRNLHAMSNAWQTVSEMRHAGATGSGADILYTMYYRQPICERRWTRWGSEPGQKRGEGYEYRLTPLGEAVRAILQEEQK